MSTVGWDEVLRVALLGAERAALPTVDATSDPRSLETLLAAVSADRTPENALLSAAGLLWQARRAGRPVPRRSTTAQPRIAPAESQPMLSRKASTMVARLARYSPMLFASWLEAVAARGCVAHFGVLTQLLDLGARNDALCAAIVRVLGHRGRWLALQNPEWSWAAPPRDEDVDAETIWRVGRREQRTAVLSRLRGVDPGRARALLESTWSKEGAEARIAFLEEMDINLNDDDEPFLEQALDTRHSSEREAVAELLARLPRSRLVTRMAHRLEALLAVGVDSSSRLPAHLKAKEALLVTLPATCDEAMTRDGMEVGTSNAQTGVGERAGLLLQMLSVVPPSHHVRRFGCSPRGLVDLAAGSEHARLLLNGLRSAAVLHGDAEMAGALVDAAVDAGYLSGTLTVFPLLEESVLSLLPPQRRAALAREALRPPLRDGHPALSLLNACTFPWDDALAKDFVRAVRASMRVSVGESDRVRSTLEKAVRWLPASCIEFAQMGWPLTDRVPAYTWTYSYNKFLDSLRLREEAWAALDDVVPPVPPPSA
ncbi:MAG: hypothetical protein EB084_10410 [Proteobacteria bacterium]|nr:hypothetical protein [Pseudomonadota bacterium]